MLRGDRDPAAEIDGALEQLERFPELAALRPQQAATAGRGGKGRAAAKLLRILGVPVEQLGRLLQFTERDQSLNLIRDDARRAGLPDLLAAQERHKRAERAGGLGRPAHGQLRLAQRGQGEVLRGAPARVLRHRKAR